MKVHKYLSHEVFCLDDVPNNIKFYFGSGYENRQLLIIYTDDGKPIGWVIKEFNPKDEFDVNYRIVPKNNDKVYRNNIERILEQC